MLGHAHAGADCEAALVALPPPVLCGLLERLDGPSLLCVGGTCRGLRTASLSPWLWPESARPPCTAWRRLPARSVLVESLCADRHRHRQRMEADEWRIAGAPQLRPRCLSVDGDRAALCLDGHVSVYDLERRERTHRFDASGDGDVVGVCARNDSVAVLAGGRTTCVWDVRDGARSRLRVRLPGAAACACWLDDRTLVTHGQRDGMRVWDLDTGACMGHPHEPADRVQADAVHVWVVRVADGLVALADENRTRLYDLRDPLCAVLCVRSPGRTSRVVAGGDRVLAAQVRGRPHDDGWRVDVRDLRAPSAPVAELPAATRLAVLAGVLRRGASADTLCCVHRDPRCDRTASYVAQEWRFGGATPASPRGPAFRLAGTPEGAPWDVPSFSMADERRLVYAARDGMRVLEHGASPSGRPDAPAHAMRLRRRRRAR